MKIYIVLLTALVAAPVPLRAQSPTVTNQPVSQDVWTGNNVRFTVGVSDTGPLTYQWQLNTTNLPSGIITTVAGNGTNGYSGDGGAATNASLNYPQGVAVDTSGNLFIADPSNERIRKVDTSGTITTVAGNGTYGYSGDGGAATNASLRCPGRIALDAIGNLLIVDYQNQRIRKVNANGIITTVAGNGTFGYSGDGGAATSASLANPAGAAMDTSGNLFFADEWNNRIRKVDTNGIIFTVAGNGAEGYSGDGGAATDASLSWPCDVTVDAFGNLFASDLFNERVRKVDTNGIISTVAGNGTQGYSGNGGAATNASLSNPAGVAVDAFGNLFIADQANAIRKVSTNGVITTVAGNGTLGYSGDGGAATNARLNDPSDVVVDAFGNLFFADLWNNRIRKVTNTQGPTLALNNVTAANAGNYQVVVTGTSGSVTSSVATLVVATSPLIYKMVIHSNCSLTLSFVSLPNSTNVVLWATNLSPPVLWQPLSTNLAEANGKWQYTDTEAVNWTTRFYRSLTR